jgi:hypothetical protein
MSGCDFLRGLSGIGVKKAHAHMRRLKSFVRVRIPVMRAPQHRRCWLVAQAPLGEPGAPSPETSPNSSNELQGGITWRRPVQLSLPGVAAAAAPSRWSRACASRASRCLAGTRRRSSARCGRSATSACTAPTRVPWSRSRRCRQAGWPPAHRCAELVWKDQSCAELRHATAKVLFSNR